MLHARFLHNKCLLYILLSYAITCCFAVIHFLQASSIEPDQSWVQPVRNNIGLIISSLCPWDASHTSHVWSIKHTYRLAYTHTHTPSRATSQQAEGPKTPTSVPIPEHSLTTFPALLISSCASGKRQSLINAPT